MPAEIHKLKFPGAMNERGFWLYVWRIDTPIGELLYVGRTGDESSPNANPPIKRMGQHLDTNEKSNALRRHLESRDIEPEACFEFMMVACGPLFLEAPCLCGSEEPEKCICEHRRPRDKVAALEKTLADALRDAGYDVMNEVKVDLNKRPLDNGLWQEVLESLSEEFPELVDA